MVKILVKKLNPKVKLPEYKTNGSSGMDLMAFIKDPITIKSKSSSLVSTGLSIAFSKNYEIQIRPRSGLAAKNSISILNTPGTIDADYRGEIKVILINLGQDTFKVEKGLRIAQMIVCPIVQAQLQEVDDLNETERGKGGFGSTGTK